MDLEMKEELRCVRERLNNELDQLRIELLRDNRRFMESILPKEKSECVCSRSLFSRIEKKKDDKKMLIPWWPPKIVGDVVCGWPQLYGRERDSWESMATASIVSHEEDIIIGIGLAKRPSAASFVSLRRCLRTEDAPKLLFAPYLGDGNDAGDVMEGYDVEDAQKRIDSECPALLQLRQRIDTSASNLISQSKHRMPASSPLLYDTDLQPVKVAKIDDSTHVDYSQDIDSYRTLLCRSCLHYDCDLHNVSCTEKKSFLRREKNSKRIEPWPTATLRKPDARARRLADKAAQIFDLDATAYVALGICGQASQENEKNIHFDRSRFKDTTNLSSTSVKKTSAVHSVTMAKKFRKTHPQRKYSSNDVLTAFKPCDHQGPCTMENGCACILRDLFCSKLCGCYNTPESFDPCTVQTALSFLLESRPKSNLVRSTLNPSLDTTVGTSERRLQDCANQFAGCFCKAQCTHRSCPCFAAGRECDADLCSSCMHGNCRNRQLSKKEYTKTAVGVSVLPHAGFGLFAPTGAEKGDLISEYVGETLSQEEAERRGRLYDKLNRSYLFEVDDATVIDAARYANKSRFANHSTQAPTCIPRTMFVHGLETRVGLFALKKIQPHTEITFDYRYSETKRSEHHTKPGLLVDWMQDASKAATVSSHRGVTFILEDGALSSKNASRHTAKKTSTHSKAISVYSADGSEKPEDQAFPSSLSTTAALERQGKEKKRKTTKRKREAVTLQLDTKPPHDKDTSDAFCTSADQFNVGYLLQPSSANHQDFVIPDSCIFSS